MIIPRKLSNYIQPVFRLLKKLPKGKVVTYKFIAQKCNIPNPRNVGWILKQNTKPSKVPCYKVVRSDGTLAKKYKFGGKESQKKRLITDGVLFNKHGRICNFNNNLTSL